MEIKESNIVLPIFSEDKNVRAERKEKFIKLSKELYPNSVDLKDSEYIKIRNRIESGDKTVVPYLLHLSINAINTAIADLYARYDIEDVLPFEEALSYSLEQFNKYFWNYDKLPEYISQYKRSLISYYSYKFVYRAYARAYKRHQNEELMSKQDLAWKKDKEDSYEIDLKELYKDEVRSLLKKTGKKLTKKQAEAIGLKFGFITGEEMRFAEVARHSKITRHWAALLVQTGLDKMRNNSNGLKRYIDNDFEV